jgi:putative SOS response-associated peptidase YedK
MCGRTTATITRDQAAELLKVETVDAPELPPSWNVAPTQPAYVAATASSGERRLRAMRWGLVPNWAKDIRTGSKLINARAETLSGKPAYREALRWRRGLAVFDGFYEWRLADRGVKAPSQPHYFRSADGRPLVFAVLWDTWWDAEGQPVRTFSIVTTAANETVAPVHHRMPVILEAGHWDEWLRPAPLGTARIRELLVPATGGLLYTYPVSTAVNSAVNNGPELIEPQPSEERVSGQWSSEASTIVKKGS